MALDNLSVGPFADDTTVDAFITARGWTKQIGWLYDDSTIGSVKVWDGTAWQLKYLIERPEMFTTRGLGAATYYASGYYKYLGTAFLLTLASPTQPYGSANIMYGANIFAVCSGPGLVTGGGTVALQISGTSIGDTGVRTLGDTEVLIPDITVPIANQYYQTLKRWTGICNWSLVVTSGAPTDYGLDINYGFVIASGYRTRSYKVYGFQVQGICTGSDAAFEVRLRRHLLTGWTYNNGAFAPPINIIVSSLTDNTPESQLWGGASFLYRRMGLSVVLNGLVGEGYMVDVVVGVVNSVQYMTYTSYLL